MNPNAKKIIYGTILLLALLLTACGGSNSVGTATPAKQPGQMGGSIQGISLNLAPTVSTLAGAAPGADGTGLGARFAMPSGVASDGTNLFVIDTTNHKIRKVVIATGAVTTLAGSGAIGAADGPGVSASFAFSYDNVTGTLIQPGIVTDGSNLYVTDTLNNKIRKVVIATGEVSSFTGVPSTAALPGATDGAATTARFFNPSGIATDGTFLYVADTKNYKIRKIAIATGDVTSMTGAADTASASGAADGAGATASFGGPMGITAAGTNLYVVDHGNNKIRKIVIATGVVSSYTGAADTSSTAGAVDGAATGATFDKPMGITTDGMSLYVADMDNNKIRKISMATGVVSSLTGTADAASLGGAVDGAGSTAMFSKPHDLAVVDGMLYVTDTNNGTIRSIAIPTSTVSTLAGNTIIPGADGTGGTASFGESYGITTDGSNLYVLDRDNNKIRKIVIATGEVTTLAGTGASGAADGPGLTATFGFPMGITTDGANLYVADSENNKIRKIVIASGVVSSLTGPPNAAVVAGADDGGSANAKFNVPVDITTDGASLYVMDRDNNKIRKIVIATGEVSSLTGNANLPSAAGAVDGDKSTAMFNKASGITTDGTNLYVADSWNNKIRKIVIASGEVSSVTGTANTASASGVADGAGLTAGFASPFGITTDGTSLYVADGNNNKIRKIVISSGEVSSLTGAASTASAIGASDGAGSTASFSLPYGICTDGTSLFVVDQMNYTIRVIK